MQQPTTGTDPIAETLSYGSELPPGRQRAYLATIQVLVPQVDTNGVTVDDETDASDYIAETLRGLFLDWSYTPAPGGGAAGPVEVPVSDPYVEGSFSAPATPA